MLVSQARQSELRAPPPTAKSVAGATAGFIDEQRLDAAGADIQTNAKLWAWA